MRKLYALICVLCVFGLSYACLYDDIQKYTTIQYIKSHQEELEQFAKGIIEDSGNAHRTASYNEWRVDYWPRTNKVEFWVGGRGLAPASTYEGFYYSPNDRPIGFQGSDYRFVEEGSGWVWRSEVDDNREYDEKIIDNWYWYKAIF